MSYTQLTARVTDQAVQLINTPLIASGSVNEVRIDFEFCSLWDGFGRTAVFYRKGGPVFHVVISDGQATIPWEVMTEPGVVFFGVMGDNGITVRTTEVLRLNVVQGAVTEATAEHEDPTPDIYRQLLSAYGSAEAQIRKGSDALAVERARIDNLVQMRSDTGAYVFTMTTENLPGTVTSNGATAFVECVPDFSLAAGAYANFYIPQTLTPLIPVEIPYSNNDITITVRVEDSTGKPMISIYNGGASSVRLQTLPAIGSYPLAGISIEELGDLRVDLYGNIHASAGEAVRCQMRAQSEGLTGLCTKTLTVADFAPGSIDASGNVNASSSSFAVTPELLECTVAKPIYVTANGKASTMYLYYYGKDGFLGVKGGLFIVGLDGGNLLSVFTGTPAEVTHVRIAINYNNNKTPITADTIADAVDEFTFTQKYFDPFVRRSEVDRAVVKVIALGDSITKATGDIGWTTYFLEKIKGEMIANVAVGGAVLANSATAGNALWLSSQVDTIANGDYAAPDIIMIAVGTNEGIRITQEDMVAAYYNGTTLIPLEDVDRTTDAGAFRYATEKLHQKYPDAMIFWCSPVHRARGSSANKKAEDIRAWNESLRIATEYTGLRHIDTIHCGINSANEVYGGAGECLADGLHPNEKGAKMIGYYNASKVNATIF